MWAKDSTIDFSSLCCICYPPELSYKKPSIQASVTLTTSSFHIKHAHFTSLRKGSRYAEVILFVSQKPQTSDWV